MQLASKLRCYSTLVFAAVGLLAACRSEPTVPISPAPSQEEEWIAIGDTLVLASASEPALNLRAMVGIDGTVLIPGLGRVMIAGLTAPEIETLLEGKLAPAVEPHSLKVTMELHAQSYILSAVDPDADGQVDAVMFVRDGRVTAFTIEQPK